MVKNISNNELKILLAIFAILALFLIIVSVLNISITGFNTGDVSLCFNSPPQISLPCSNIAYVGDLYFCDVDATDNNADQDLTFTDNTTLFGINNSTGIISFTPSSLQNGAYSIKISVNDGSVCSNNVTSEILILDILFLPSCSDDIQNQGEAGIDCGGPCAPCPSGGEGVIIEEGEEIHIIDSIIAGASETIKIENEDELGIQEIEITVKNTVSNVEITVRKEDAKPSDVPTPLGSVHSYLTITASNIEDKDIETSKIKFKVSKDWITSNNIDKNTVSFNRFKDSDWTKLGTRLLSEDTNFIFYESETPGFSVFAVIGERIKPKICTPGEERCSRNDLQECNPEGVWITTETCAYGCENNACKEKPEEVLFDINLNILENYKKVFAGEDVLAQIELINLGRPGRIDVTLNYLIKDIHGNIILEKTETLAVETRTSFVRTFHLAQDLKPDKYTVSAELLYDGFLAVSSDTFEIIEKEKLIAEISTERITIIVVLVTIIILLLLLLLHRKLKPFLKKVGIRMKVHEIVKKRKKR